MITEKEHELVMFFNKYKIVSSKEIKYLFESSQYYRVQLENMLRKKLIRKKDNYYLIATNGINQVKTLGYEYKRMSTTKDFIERLKIISSIATLFYLNKNVEYISSIDIKDKNKITITSRRYIGILRINHIDYLTYYISKDHIDKYISSIFFDIQKEKKHRHIIILTEDITRIPIADYKFGLYEILIVPYTVENQTLLGNMPIIDWQKILDSLYPNEKVIISKYNFIDYVTDNDNYINVFTFVDSEKIDSCKRFMLENKNKQLHIVCNKEIKDIIKQEIPKASYTAIDLNNYIKEQTHYD